MPVIDRSKRPVFTKQVQMTSRGYAIMNINQAKNPSVSPPQVGGGSVKASGRRFGSPTWKKIIRGEF